eukprot:CAMPEP_0204256584 /NCGR_PEP_ID=MMETSP0468-20130131/3874_1 /ASSEMBLY_ACC=CAM_ASM_000383 /TAXON_ID=2969 /ORGANISM="Oxyrrhis marina" /LENGTH=87 /DNA_ID=CAMNT_0051230569 /DNA_START=511 /DNA_END=774 /DNA_ORIENTATION=+
MHNRQPLVGTLSDPLCETFFPSDPGFPDHKDAMYTKGLSCPHHRYLVAGIQISLHDQTQAVNAGQQNMLGSAKSRCCYTFLQAIETL